MKITTSNFSLERVKNPDHFWLRVEKQIQNSRDSDLVLFPEYFSISWVLSRTLQKKFNDNLKKCDETLKEFLSRFKILAKKYSKVLVAGTHPVKIKGKIINRCHVFFPDGKILKQDKINMTRFEDESWGVVGGTRKLTTFKIGGRTFAILICYDSEFSGLSLELAKKRVDVLLVPSCTDEIYGYWRVRHCCEARCIENQCFTVVSSIVGADKRYEDINGHYGRACILSPCDHGFPGNGVLAESKGNHEEILTYDLDFKNLDRIRKDGTVLNLRDSIK